jgi:neutral ceramidase
MKPLACFLVLALAFANVRAAELRAGAAAVRITPDVSMPLAGYYHTRWSTNTHDDLHAKALVLESGNTRAALVVCDLLTLPRHVVEAARELIERTAGVPGSNVMISATHTHTAPVLDMRSARAIAESTNAALVRRYTEELPKRIAEAVREAARALQTTHLSVGREQETHLSHNRRFHMRDGSVGWNPGKLNTNIVRVAGPIDPNVDVLFFESPSPRRAPIATYVNFAMHPDTVGGLEFSADYAFTLARLLGDYRGSNMVTLFANGACGNINHVDVHWANPQRGHAEAARLGTILAGNVFKAYTRLKPVSAGELRVRSAVVPLTVAEIQPDEVLAAKQTIARIDSKSPPRFLKQVHAFKVLDVAARAGRPWEVEVQVVALGREIAWVSLPGEVFVELGLSIKQRSPFPHTLLAELANGSIGYIPDAKAYHEGNYEPISARCAKGSGEKLADTAVRLLNELAQ